MVYCQFENWELYHNDLLLQLDKGLTNKYADIYACDDINAANGIKKSESVEMYDVKVTEILGYLITIAAQLTETPFTDAVARKYLNKFNDFRGTNLTFDKLTSMVLIEDLNYLGSALKTYPSLKSTIFSYYIKNVTSAFKLTSVDISNYHFSIFNLIYIFLNATPMSEVVFDAMINQHISNYVKVFKEKLAELGNLLPYAELISPDLNEIGGKEWPQLAALSFIHFFESRQSDCRNIANWLENIKSFLHVTLLDKLQAKSGSEMKNEDIVLLKNLTDEGSYKQIITYFPISYHLEYLNELYVVLRKMLNLM